MTETTQQVRCWNVRTFGGLPISVCADIVSMARTRDYLRQVMFWRLPNKGNLLLTDGRAKITQVV